VQNAPLPSLPSCRSRSRARLAASLHRQTGQVASGSNLSDALTVLMGEASELDPRLKAGWSYGIAPGATTTAGTYRLRSGDPASPGRMPSWFAREVIRATTTALRQPVTPPTLPQPTGPGPAAYLTTVITRGAAQLAVLTDGRKRTLSALAYQAGGLLEWAGADQDHVAGQLIDAGTAAGLAPRDATRIVNRAITNGISRPVAQPGSAYDATLLVHIDRREMQRVCR
jgi:hypothetical protein